MGRKLEGWKGGGDGEKKVKESEEFEEQNCIYEMAIIALNLINSLARVGGKGAGGARRWDLAIESSCMRVGESE
jgi:hypothetical protein